MKTILSKSTVILLMLFFAISIASQSRLASALEGESLNSDVPKESSKELKDTTPSESLNDDDAKSPCPPPYIKLVSPRAAVVGATISIQGWRFGKDEGQVVFPKGISANIISWRNQYVEVEVPAGAETGNVKLISACGTESKKGQGGYFTIMQKPKENKSY